MLSDKASDLIRELVHARRFGPTDVLTEKALAEQLGMSRTPIRTALFRLEDAGLVERLPGHGWRVRRLTTGDLEEIFQMKSALEVLAVRLAANSITPEQGERLLALVARLEDSAGKGDLDTWLMHDEDFHALIIAAAGNRRLESTVKMLNDQWYRLRPTYMTISGRVDAATVEHRELAEAIVAHEVETACEAARHHLEQIHLAVLRVMDAIMPLVGGNTI